MADEIQLNRILDPKLTEQQVSEVVAQYCEINLADIETALSRQASLYSYVVAAYELAKVAEAQEKWNFEQTKADAFIKIQSLDPKESATSIDRKILQAQTVRDAAKAHFSAQANTARLKALVSGLEHRRDMLVQIAAKMRQEMGMS